MTDGCKILIVEDQMLIALDLERLIAGMDYQVCGIARTRTEALRLAEEHRPDLVVMDVRLADGSDGIAAARELRQRFGIAALLISGQIDAAQAEQAEASSFLRKPLRRASSAAPSLTRSATVLNRRRKINAPAPAPSGAFRRADPATHAVRAYRACPGGLAVRACSGFREADPGKAPPVPGPADRSARTVAETDMGR
jgi:CheY-like chemotaxis protein